MYRHTSEVDKGIFIQNDVYTSIYELEPENDAIYM
jgi:hypothetical protein